LTMVKGSIPSGFQGIAPTWHARDLTNVAGLYTF